MHLNIAGRKDNPAEWDLAQKVSERLVLKTIALGGTATGEHGVGLGKRKYMTTQHGTSLAWMQRVKPLRPERNTEPGQNFSGISKAANRRPKVHLRLN